MKKKRNDERSVIETKNVEINLVIYFEEEN